ncbi:hypothetical protein DAPPUDRAFT_116170 [Daphnia pulex]|uniref:Uncharacterized protein n=1 Tax=Daphnia pulex TaxID=6669 RepID=E9HNT1_DAPPU|nr:hypothetical protein DAPPUDRAFT_116170 [Daphnia pulex]|eukprot:EFX66609.1 hypothetical protein DAPPUDRAFT_116170 [Daphnia pulex]
MTRAIGLINGFATRVMTQEDINSIGVQESRLKSLYEKYHVTSKEIEEKLKAIKAAQEELDEEQKITLQTQDEVLGARRAIIKPIRESGWKQLRQKKGEEKERRMLANQIQMTRDLIAQVMAATLAPPTPILNVTTAPAPASAIQSIRLPQQQIKHFRVDMLEWTILGILQSSCAFLNIFELKVSEEVEWVRMPSEPTQT